MASLVPEYTSAKLVTPAKAVSLQPHSAKVDASVVVNDVFVGDVCIPPEHGLPKNAEVPGTAAAHSMNAEAKQRKSKKWTPPQQPISSSSSSDSSSRVKEAEQDKAAVQRHGRRTWRSVWTVLRSFVVSYSGRV